MFKFYKKIRQSLLAENKTGKYLKYAFGEIVLVVIGILIALSLNNWNESRMQSKKELSLLANLKNSINDDIVSLKQQDSLFLVFENNAALGIELFYKAKTIKDIDSVAKLTRYRWNVLYINNNSYNEMINSGNMYTMKNKELQKKITAYYLNVEADKNYISEVNKEQAQLNTTQAFYPFRFLISQLKKHQISTDLIDTTWINNPNSSTYLAVVSSLESNYETNIIYRRIVYNRNIMQAEKLLADINNELEVRSK